MEYITAKDAANLWGITERRVCTYCKEGRIMGAIKDSGIWKIPSNSAKPDRKPRKKNMVLDRILEEKKTRTSGGIYYRIQIDMAYNSNHMEGSRLSHEQTRNIFETATIGIDNTILRIDDIIEATNHFRCVDEILDTVHAELSEKYIKNLHRMLKQNTSDSRETYFALGDYKRFPNEVGGNITTAPENVPSAMAELLKKYKAIPKKELDDLLDFHVQFEKIHPFQDGNGRVGRLILFKECLRYGVVPFIILDDLKLYYYRGLREWGNTNGFLRDTCLTAQDHMKKYLDYFRIPY